MVKDKHDSPRRGFKFFRDRAMTGDLFTIDELANESGWSESSINTYRSKQWPDLLEEEGDKFRVRKEFLRLTEKEFLDHITQKRPLFAKYERKAHPAILIFEFLLPLTRESELRSALDELFFADTIRQRLQEIGLNKLENLLVRKAGELDNDYLNRAVEFSNRFYGYSISHVSGRFRASSDLMAREEAAIYGANGGRYLIDETTAVVRFILPLQTASRKFSDSLFMPTNLNDEQSVDHVAVTKEANELRTIFFLLFVEAIVRIIKGEDEIWLLERGVQEQLYVWSRQ